MKRQPQSEFKSPILRHLSQDRGWTLIELLIGATMMLAVVFAALPLIDGAVSTEGRIQTAALSIGDARVFSDQVLRDLRPATKLTSSTSKRLTVVTYVRATACGSGTASAADADPIPCRVTYDCSASTPATTPATYSCTREEEGGPAVTMITGLSSDDVFGNVLSPYDEPVFVSVTIVIPNQENVGGDAITLQDGTALRNVGAT